MVALTLAHQVSSCRALPKVNVQTGCLVARSVVALVAAMEKSSNLTFLCCLTVHFLLISIFAI